MKTLLITAAIIFLIYALICAIAYFNQERLIFLPTKLPLDFKFQFKKQPKENFIVTSDSIQIHGLHFKTDSSKGLVFYLHGNAGALDSWGEVYETYTSLNYDVFIMDFRGYGKSEGEIFSEEQFFDDVQLAYDEMKKEYPEEKIIVLGYSVGTASASMLAARNNPRHLILQALITIWPT